MLPGISNDVVEVDIGAGIGNIAADGVGVEEALMDADIFEGDVAHGDSWLRGASTLLVERVEHAAWAVPVRLLHLLRTDIDGPPDWPVHREVLVEDVLDKATPLISRIRFHVDTLKWANHTHIAEGNVADTVAVTFRRNTSDRHSYSKNNCAVLHQEVTSAVSSPLRLGDNHIVPVLYGKVVEVKTCTGGVDAISIEREHDECALKGESFNQVDLGSDVNFNINVVEESVVAVV